MNNKVTDINTKIDFSTIIYNTLRVEKCVSNTIYVILLSNIKRTKETLRQL